MSSRMRITRGKTGSRRSHIKLSAPRLSTDKETGNLHLRHHVDMETGMYRGKKILEPKAPKVKAQEEAPEEETDVTEAPAEVPAEDAPEPKTENVPQPENTEEAPAPRESKKEEK